MVSCSHCCGCHYSDHYWHCIQSVKREDDRRSQNDGFDGGVTPSTIEAEAGETFVN